MIQVKRFIFNSFGVNTYVVWDSKDGIIIDCGCQDSFEWDELYSFIKKEKINIRHILNTHLHIDHVLGNRYAVKEFDLDIEANKLDYPLYLNLRDQVAMFFGEQATSLFNYDFTQHIGPSLDDNSKIQFGSETLEVITSPGHSPGSICFYNRSNDILFSGDTLFQSSIGRTDLPGGNYTDIISSLSRLTNLPSSTTIYSGHGNATTIASELIHNPFLR